MKTTATIAAGTPTSTLESRSDRRRGGVVRRWAPGARRAGGILSDGKLVAEGSQIECPLHGSRYELATGYKKRGPTTYDQPRYDVRRTEAGGWEALRIATHD